MATANQYRIVESIKKLRHEVHDCLDVTRYEADGIEYDTGMPIEQPADILTSKTDYLKDRIVSHAQAGKNLATRAIAYIDALGTTKAKAAFDAVIPGNSEDIAAIRAELAAMITYADKILSDTGKATSEETLKAITTYVDANVPIYESHRRLWAILEAKEAVK